jgi:3-phenylpropionate/cinnamic acid dioxygenase small subunit
MPLSHSLAWSLDSATRAEIEALVFEYAWLVDHGHADQIPDLYTVDGTFAAVDPPAVGRDQLRSWAEERTRQTARTTRHIHPNIRLTRVSDDEVHGCIALILFRSDTADVANTKPRFIGEYNDVYRYVNDRWLIQRRALAIAFSS